MTRGSRTTLRVAAAQAESVPGDVPANVATAVSLVDTAAGRGARVVVLPELFLTGYAPESWSAAHGVDPDDARLDPLARAASRHGVVVVASAAVRRPPGGPLSARHTLSAVVLDDAGEVHVAYDKQHLVDAEPAFFGRCGETTLSGGSAVYDPEGRALVRAGSEAPAVVVADLRADEVARVRELNPVARDRLASLGERVRVTLGVR